MAIDPRIALGGPSSSGTIPQIDSAFGKQNTMAIKNLRQQQEQNDITLRTQKMNLEAKEAEAKKAADQEVYSETVRKHMKVDPETGRVESDDAAITKIFSDTKRLDFLEQYQAYRDAHKLQAQERTLAELKQQADVIDALGGQAAHLQTMGDIRMAQPEYLKLRGALAQFNPERAKSMPNFYDAAVVDGLVKEMEVAKMATATVAQKIQIQSEQRQLIQARTDELKAKAAALGPSAKVKEMMALQEEFKDVPEDKRREAFKMAGIDLPAAENKTAAEDKVELIREAWAVKNKKDPKNLTAEEKLKAEREYDALTPDRQTDFDKDLNLLKTNPAIWEKLHGRDSEDAKLTPAQNATVLRGIMADISRLKASLTDPMDEAAAAAYYEAERQRFNGIGASIPPYKAQAPARPAATGMGDVKKSEAKPPVTPKPAPAAKRVAQRSDIEAAAKKAGISYEELKRRVEAAGGEVSP